MPIIETVIARVLGDTASGALTAAWRKIKPQKTAALDEKALAAAARDPAIDDFVTGAGQALMAVRDAVEHFERYGVLVDLPEGTLEESGAGYLREVRRTVDEAEARLPRVQARLGTSAPLIRAGAAAVKHLREALARLRDYTEQPGEGETWDLRPLKEARAALAQAERHQRGALDAAALR